jgi:hypothetical protein
MEGRRRKGKTRPDRPPASASAALTRAWAWELASVEYLGVSRGEIELRLRGQLDTLVGLLLADPFSPQPARQVGADLVDLKATQSEALRRTLLLLTDRLLTDQPISAEAGRYRLSRLLIELAVGWVDASHRSILTAQEELHRAVDTARDRDRAPRANPWFE